MPTSLQIIKMYGETVPKTTRGRKIKATRLLHKALCNCIKNPRISQNHKRAIAMCTKTIFTRRGLKRGAFTCKERGATVKWKRIPTKTNKRKK